MMRKSPHKLYRLVAVLWVVAIVATVAIWAIGRNGFAYRQLPGERPLPERPVVSNEQQRANQPTPLSCLKQAALTNVEQRDSDLWWGFESSGLVRVSLFASQAEARQALKDADLLIGKQSGRYAVFGGVPGGPEESAVASVASCLKG